MNEILTDLTCSASAFTPSAPGTTFPDIFSEMSNKLLIKCLTKYYVAQFSSVKLPTAELFMCMTWNRTTTCLDKLGMADEMMSEMNYSSLQNDTS
jgi:hypothetical protein